MIDFGKSGACGQIVLPDSSILNGQKKCKMAKYKRKCYILINFQALCCTFLSWFLFEEYISFLVKDKLEKSGKIQFYLAA